MTKYFSDNHRISKYFKSVSTLTVLIIIAGCSSVKDDLVSPSRVKIKDINSTIIDIKNNCKDSKINKISKIDCTGSKLKIIGHGAGSYNHYPMDVNNDMDVVGNDGKLAAYNVNDLVDDAFKYGDETNIINALEVDVVAPNRTHLLCQDNNNECSFILHNMPKWDDLNKSNNTHAFKYMRRNSLRTVLNHFVESGFHISKRLYLELKVPGVECTSPLKYQNIKTKSECFNAAREVQKEIKRLYEKNPNLLQEKNDWLYITSFSAASLQQVHEKFKNEKYKDKINYSLVVGYDTKGLSNFLWIKSFLAQLKGPVPEFTPNIEEFIIESTFLREIWFSVKGMSKPYENFQNIHKKRSKKINFSVAHYDVKKRKFEKRLENFALPLSSVMIDVDD